MTPDQRAGGRYVEVSRSEALAAPRTFIRYGGHYFLCPTMAEAFEREQFGISVGYTPRWYVWSTDLSREVVSGRRAPDPSVPLGPENA